MDEDFDLEDLKTLKGGKGLAVHETRAWLCVFMKAFHKAHRRWPSTPVIAKAFGTRPDTLRTEHLRDMVKLGFLKQTPPPYSSLTRYRVVKDYEYELPGFTDAGDAPQKGKPKR